MRQQGFFPGQQSPGGRQDNAQSSLRIRLGSSQDDRDARQGPLQFLRALPRLGLSCDLWSGM